MTVYDDCIRAIELEQELGGYTRIDSSIPWRDRFALYRRNYRLKEKLVKAGVDAWDRADPYEIADWDSIFTPIERALWWDIRANALPLWPQYPVGRYFVDFGNPVRRVAVECDGRAYHQDKEADAARDADLRRMGWTVLRIEGWQCKGVAPEYDPDMTEEEHEQRRRHIQEKTPARLIEKLEFLLR